MAAPWLWAKETGVGTDGSKLYSLLCLSAIKLPLTSYLKVEWRLLQLIHKKSGP